MICPNCGNDNLPGAEECGRCGQDLTQLDRPVANDPVERSLIEDPVGRLHPRAPVTMPATATVGEGIHRMLDNNVGALLIVDADGKLVGIFSERDLLTKVVGIHLDYATLPLGAVMTRSPATVNPEHPLAFVLHQMDVGGYRHVPVLQDGRPVGVISVRDMLRHITRLCKTVSPL